MPKTQVVGATMELTATLRANQDLTSLTGITPTAKIAPEDDLTSAVALGVTVPNPNGTEVVLSLTDTQTAAFNPGRFFVEITLTDQSGEVRKSGISTVNFRKSIP